MDILKGRTAFVTGAASGIGLGVATRLLQAGVKVMLSDVREGALHQAVANLGAAGHAGVAGVVADVSRKTDLQQAADATLARFGEVHILHNNAGVLDEGGYGQWTDAGWHWTIGINLMSVIWGVEIFGPLIERHGRGGQIINTASIAGLVAFRSGAYRVTKYAVVAMSEGLRHELEPRGIGVSVLCPGFVRTQISDSLLDHPGRQAAAPDAPVPGSGAPGNGGQESATARVEGGLDPLYVGDLVCEGIKGNWPYIFTDTEFEPAIATRFDAIRAGFDRIRGRVPP